MTLKETLKTIKSSEQTISMIFGIGIVLLIGGLIYNYFQRKTREIIIEPETQEQVSEETVGQTPPKPLMTLPATYEVQKGDHLWKIAEKYYGSGYNWVDIAKENQIAEPNLIEVGQKLTIPNTSVKTPVAAVYYGPEITGETYTIQKGDWLSKIAARAYGDTNLWPKIWGANRDQISDPNQISEGVTIKIPR